MKRIVFIDADGVLVYTNTSPRKIRPSDITVQDSLCNEIYVTTARPGALDFLKVLRKEGITICALTTGVSTFQINVLKKLGLLQVGLLPLIDTVYGREHIQGCGSIAKILKGVPWVLLDDYDTNTNLTQKGGFLGISFSDEILFGLPTPSEWDACIAPWFIKVDSFSGNTKSVQPLTAYLPQTRKLLETRASSIKIDPNITEVDLPGLI